MIFSIFLFLIGLVAGSFANVLVSRYDPSRPVFSKKALSGRSICPSCGKKLNFFELIPIVSFVLQKGKCSGCKNKISFQYPIIELVSGAMFFLVPFFLSGFFGVPRAAFFSLTAPLWSYCAAALWLFVFFIFLLIVAIDLKHYVVPNGLNIALIFFGVLIGALLELKKEEIFPFHASFLGNYALVFSPFGDSPLLNRLFGGAAGGLFFFLLFLISRARGIGFGDVKLALALGFVLGWPDIALAIIISFIAGGVVSLALYLARRKIMKDRVPFAPFFILGALAAIFSGHAILNWYFGLLI